MRHVFGLLAVVAMFTALTGCSSQESQGDDVATETSVGDFSTESGAVSRIVVVRHAERAGSDADPDLTTDGTDRANRLAVELAPDPGVAVYATPYKRTQQTAAPTAKEWKLDVTTYEPARDPAPLVAKVRTDHPTGVVLIVGHSETASSIVASLCGCDVAPISETDFGNLYWVDLAADGRVVDYQHRTSY
ncbi:phosphoglycerate mutase family protein [Antrihabitans sp. NCIMB 15449]|uniref:Phosphoglycerate mutase family protein n=1 Tax=Antrihabitans spumae TaxID=3373370 RepID=A0ABW7JPX2_9NOCA